ncbi:hypothetical protein Tco_0366206 [Tanacetum coccineum]
MHPWWLKKTTHTLGGVMMMVRLLWRWCLVVRWRSGDDVVGLVVRWCAWQCGGYWWHGGDGVVGVMIAVVVRDGDDGVGWWWPRGGGCGCQ